MFEVSNIHKDFFSFLSASAAAAAIPSMKQWEEGKMGTISFSFQKFPRDCFKLPFIPDMENWFRSHPLEKLYCKDC